MRGMAKDPRTVSLVGEFMNVYLPSVRRLDDDTVASYRTSISLYLDYLRDSRGISLATLTAADVCQESVVGFMSWLAETRGNVATTINHRLNDVRGLCHFLASRGAIDAVTHERIREVCGVPDDRATEFTWLTVEEVRAVLRSVSPNRDATRDLLILSLLYESGGRIGEVLNLTVGDLRPTKDGEVDVHFYGKGRKHRVTPLSAEIWRQYLVYADTYLKGAGPSSLVFYTRQHGVRHVMSHDNVSRILRGCERTLRAGELPNLQHLHSHLFRRSRAMHLYEAGVPLPTISDWLGHSNIETTRFYAKVTDIMKRSALEKLSEGKDAVFKPDVAFKYASDEDVLRRLCGLR
jgi:site-specific recombinase XerD